MSKRAKVPPRKKNRPNQGFANRVSAAKESISSRSPKHNEHLTVMQKTMSRRKDDVPQTKHANRDPITGVPGAHPLGTGIGAVVGGAAAGAALGTTVAGPVGTAVGIAAGAVVGGLAGKGVAETIDPTAEEAYWRENYRTRAYVDEEAEWDAYASAYRTGYEGYGRYAGQSYEEIEADLQRDYERVRGDTGVGWDKARYAARDAWDRVERSIPGEADKDGR